uniref:Alternative protein DMWD n=1 Tax=Homo sapiens TaxID=9606 RepID=L8E855_HUMAN|nr:alternative protein DMWD [Homo sapiens]
MEAPQVPPCPAGPLIYTKVPCFLSGSVPFGGDDVEDLCVYSVVLGSPLSPEEECRPAPSPAPPTPFHSRKSRSPGRERTCESHNW